MMKKILDDPWLLVICIGLGITLLLGGLIFYMRSGGEETPARELPDAETRREASTAGGARIIEDEEFTGPVIRYTDSGFIPYSTSLTREDAESTECLIKFKNDSAGELLIRLGPPQEIDNKGFPYDPIPSGKTGIIDPRYSHIFEEEFYNRKNPAHRLAIRLNELCFE